MRYSIRNFNTYTIMCNILVLISRATVGMFRQLPFFLSENLGVKFYQNQTKLRCFWQHVYTVQGIVDSRKREGRKEGKDSI